MDLLQELKGFNMTLKLLQVRTNLKCYYSIVVQCFVVDLLTSYNARISKIAEVLRNVMNCMDFPNHNAHLPVYVFRKQELACL